MAACLRKFGQVSRICSWKPSLASLAQPEAGLAVHVPKDLVLSSQVVEVPLNTGRKKLCILGTGWAAARLLRDISPQHYEITVISPRNHMVFTPLLASACIGTLSLKSVALPVWDIQAALSWPKNHYIAASARAIRAKERKVECVSQDGAPFTVSYDKLVIATGAAGSTFGIPGVQQHAHFLRDLGDATGIRHKLIDNLALANSPGRSREETNRLLHVVIVGGGPTGVEFAGELVDLIDSDVSRLYPQTRRDVKLTLVEGRDILGSFDLFLREYAARHLINIGVQLVKAVVHEVRKTELVLSDGRVIPFGLCVWSTGVGPTAFTESLPFAKTNVGRLAVNAQMQVLIQEGQALSAPSDATDARMDAAEAAGGHGGGKLKPCDDLFALGDCCADVQAPLPALAQVAEQQGRYVAAMLNRLAAQQGGLSISQFPPFQYKHVGSMASVGKQSAVLEVGKTHRSFTMMRGLGAWLAWRSAYLTRLGSWKKRIEVAMDWTLTLLFGRDLSRF